MKDTREQAGEEETGQEGAGRDETGHGRTRQEGTGQHEKGQERRGEQGGQEDVEPEGFTWDADLARGVLLLGTPTYRHVPARVRGDWLECLVRALREVVFVGTPASCARLLLLPACVLGARLGATGQGVAGHIRDRARRWLHGDFDGLLLEALELAQARAPPEVRGRVADSLQHAATGGSERRYLH